jgi:predicted  nucleic acid-binding Zn-ribbon protein
VETDAQIIERLAHEARCARAEAAARLNELNSTIARHAIETETLRKVAGAAEGFYEAVTMNLGPCAGPHNGEPCYDCHIAGEHARAEREAGERLTAALDAFRGL